MLRGQGEERVEVSAQPKQPVEESRKMKKREQRAVEKKKATRFLICRLEG